MKNIISFILVLILFTVSFDCFSQEKIDKSKEELKRGTKSHDSNRRNHSRSSSESSENYDSFQNVIFRGAAQVFIFVTYYAAIGNPLRKAAPFLIRGHLKHTQYRPV